MIYSLISRILTYVQCVSMIPNRNETTRPDLAEKNSPLYFPSIFSFPKFWNPKCLPHFLMGYFHQMQTDWACPTPPLEGLALGSLCSDCQALGSCRGRVLCSSQTYQESFAWSQAQCEQGRLLQLSYLPLKFCVSEPLELPVKSMVSTMLGWLELGSYRSM